MRSRNRAIPRDRPRLTGGMTLRQKGSEVRIPGTRMTGAPPRVRPRPSASSRRRLPFGHNHPLEPRKADRVREQAGLPHRIQDGNRRGNSFNKPARVLCVFKIAEPRSWAALLLRLWEEHLSAGSLGALSPCIRIAQKTVKGRSVVKALWNRKVVAESEDTVVVECNHYFPREAVHPLCLRDSDMYSICSWKGRAGITRLRLIARST